MDIKGERKRERTFEVEVAGKTIQFTTGFLAQQAHGACTAKIGGTVVLATAVISDQPREGVDFFPLMVDYEERLYAAGKIKGSRWIKREGRPSDEAVLSARMVDRSIRPLFPKSLKNDVQVVITVLSVDGENDSDILGLLAASAALAISPIPWDGPIGGVRLGLIPSKKDPQKNEWVINPTFDARERSILDMVVAGTYQKVLMIEATAKETQEEYISEGIEFSQKWIKRIVETIQQMVSEVGKEKLFIPSARQDEKSDEESAESEKEMLEKAQKWIDDNVENVLFQNNLETKESRKEVMKHLEQEFLAYLENEGIGKERRKKALSIFDEEVKQIISNAILREGRRVDGRGLDDIRSIFCEVGVLPRTHGSAIFSRGQTQILSVVTLGSPGEEQFLEGIEESGKKHYMHHYNFPQFSVGEIGVMRSPGRREIGHGALAERAIYPLLPPREEFPYTIRVVSEVLSSNGSSSMGAVCGSSLALMDAGVPLKKPVAGIAMGLASDDQGNYKIITDLQDLEDGPGGMDFKVAGTSDGITAIQMDTKTKGLSLEICRETLQKAKQARLKILQEMARVIEKPRPELSPYAPRVMSITINPSKIRDVIGAGGKVINEIIEKTGVQIDIEPDGLIYITARNSEASEKAKAMIENIVREINAGDIINGKVTRIMDFGAIVELTPGREGMIHISELAHHRVRRVEDIVKVGDAVTVKVLNVDSNGKIGLSLKALQPEPHYSEQHHRRNYKNSQNHRSIRKPPRNSF